MLLYDLEEMTYQQILVDKNHNRSILVISLKLCTRYAVTKIYFWKFFFQSAISETFDVLHKIQNVRKTLEVIILLSRTIIK